LARTAQIGGTPAAAAPLVLHETSSFDRGNTMENSIYQARWLLAPIFLLGFGVIAFGFMA
jgi:hypothetical protein